MCICPLISCCLRFMNKAHWATIFLWTAGILCTVSIVSPFWLSEMFQESHVTGEECERLDIGLLMECCANKENGCTWVWQNGFQLENALEGWLKAIQGLFVSGFLLLIPALLMSPLRYCSECGRMSARLSKVLAVFTLLSACLLGSAALYFLYIMIWVKNLVILIVTPLHRWSWAFDFGISGIAFTIASAVFWYLDSKREVGYLAIQNQEEQNPERRGFSKR